METKKRTQATDIAEIATKLDGKVKFSSIIYSQQMLSEKYRETGVNDMYFIGKKFGLWFYTSRAALRKFIEFVRNKIITRRGFAPGTITKIMAKYILSKKAKGKKYQYTVTDEKGNVISTRTSARDYVACTANGEFYFGRLDLIGKGDHGKGLSRTTEILKKPR